MVKSKPSLEVEELPELAFVSQTFSDIELAANSC